MNTSPWLNRPAQPVLAAAAQAAFERRAAVRRRLRHTNTDVHELLNVLIRTNPDLGNIPVRSALTELPGFGAVTVDALLAELGIDGTKRLRNLGTNEAARLAQRLDTR